jgi:hypothetical protein
MKVILSQRLNIEIDLVIAQAPFKSGFDPPFRIPYTTKDECFTALLATDMNFNAIRNRNDGIIYGMGNQRFRMHTKPPILELGVTSILCLCRAWLINGSVDGGIQYTWRQS